MARRFRPAAVSAPFVLLNRLVNSENDALSCCCCDAPNAGVRSPASSSALPAPSRCVCLTIWQQAGCLSVPQRSRFGMQRRGTGARHRQRTASGPAECIAPRGCERPIRWRIVRQASARPWHCSRRLQGRQAFTNRERLERGASSLLGHRRDLPELLRIRKRGIGNPETNRRDRDGGRGRVRDDKKSRCSSAAHAESASQEIAVFSRSRKLVEEVSTKLSCPKIATATYACG